MSGSIPSWARVGAKVVCVDDSSYGAGPIFRGTVYTIQSVNFPYLRLLECPGFIQEYGGYYWNRFRPLVTDEQREADLAQFRKLLTIREPEAA